MLQSSTAGSLPVQNTNATIYIQQYYAYSKDQRRTGLQLMQLSMSTCIGALIFWFLALLKNLKATALAFLLTLQWLHTLSLIDTVFAPNIGQFLEGFRFANLFFWVTDPSPADIWLLNSSYREVLWGVVNYFDFRTSILPSLLISIFFFSVYAITRVLYLRLKEPKH
jgi:hypothetical protein